MTNFRSHNYLPFENVTVGCCQGDNQDCICTHNERVLRAYVDGRVKDRMTDVQRNWCIDEAADAGEGYFAREELQALDDVKLAGSVLTAWWRYIQSNCL